VNAKHTKGPWRFSTKPQPNGCPIVGANGLMICMLAHTVNQPEQRETALANASLIAAAPDLLVALRAITDQLERIGDTRRDKDGQFIEDAREAIAKAEGSQ
jgi:hypothetical protein